MSAVWIRLRMEARATWRSLVGLALLIGIVGGTAIAAAAGAQRTDSVVDRLVTKTRPPEVYIATAFQDNGESLKYEKIAAFPEIAESAVFKQMNATVGDADVEVGLSPDSFWDASRYHFVEGTLPPADDAHQAVINVLARDTFGWHTGTEVDLQLSGVQPAFEDAPTPPGPKVRVRIAGVTASIGDLSGNAEPEMTVSPAFGRSYLAKTDSYDLQVYRLKRGYSDLPALEKRLKVLTGGKPVFVLDTRATIGATQRSFHVHANALWLFSFFLIAAAIFIFGQSFSRMTLLRSSDNPTLRALGMSAKSLTLLALIRIAVIASAASLVAGVVAFGLSPLTPFGRPATLEISPGARFATSTIFLGCMSIIAISVALSAYQAWRSAHPLDDAPISRPSVIAGWISRVVPRPSPGVGARLAFERGHGASAVPVRSSLTSAILGITALIVALSFATNMDHLLTTPALYGWPWAVSVDGDFTPEGSGTRVLDAMPSVAAYSTGNSGGAFFVVGDRVTDGMLYKQIKGSVTPPVLSGSLPRGIGEVALGPKTLKQTRNRIGDTIDVRLQGSDRSARARITGTVVLPFSNDQTALGEGVLAPLEIISLLLDPSAFEGHPFPDTAFVRFAPGADTSKAIEALTKAFPPVDGQSRLSFPRTPDDLADFARVNALPYVVLGVVALLSGGTITHVLWGSVRRRRRDLAILKALGFERGQVRRAVVWQATALAVATAVVAVPLGLGLSARLWQAFANSGGFVSEVVVQPTTVLIVVASMLVLSQIVAAFPARTAARTQPASVLRSL